MALRNFDETVKDIDDTELLEVVKSIEGVVIPDKDGKPQFKPIHLRKSIANAITGNYDGESNLPFDKKRERYRLAKKIIKGGNIDLDSNEIALVNQMATKGLTTLVFGQAIDALEYEIEIPGEVAP